VASRLDASSQLHGHFDAAIASVSTAHELHFLFCRLERIMAPKISSMLGFREREQLHKNPSILAYTGDVGQNYLDLDDGYGDQENEDAPAAPSRAETTVKRERSNSRLTSSISSSLHSARSAVAARAKKLHVRESTRQAISQLRKSMAKGPATNTQRSQCSSTSMPAQHESNQLDNDHFGPVGDQVGLENAGFECMYAEVSLGNEMEFRNSTRRSTTVANTSSSAKGRLAKLLPSRPWIKGSKRKSRYTNELY
jgi:hypothetical protein